MSNISKLFSPGFVAVNLVFALVTSIAAVFFVFAGYLQQLGIPPAVAGFILSADALAALIVLPLITPLLHPGTARRWLVGGSVILAAALFMMGHVSSVPLLTAARLLQGTGFSCVVAALITITVQFIPQEMSGSAFGYISLVRLLPYAFIPLIFGIFSITSATFKSVLNVATLTALLPIFMLMLPAAPHSLDEQNSRSPGLAGLAASVRSAPVIVVLLSSLLFYCGHSAIFYYLKQFCLAAKVDANAFFTIATVMIIVVRLFGGRLFDSRHKELLCAAGLFIAAACYVLLPLTSDRHMFFVLAGISGLGWGIAMPLQAAAMFDISTPATRAMNQNLLMLVMQGGFFIGPFLGGQLISNFGYGILFFCLAGMALVAGFLMIGLRRLKTTFPLQQGTNN